MLATLAPVDRFISDVRHAFETETTMTCILADTKKALERLLTDREAIAAFERGDLRRGKVYTDPEHLFCVSVSVRDRGGAGQERRGVLHDHGELGWAVYGVLRGKVTMALYQRLDDGSVPGRAELRALPPVAQKDGEAVIIPVGGIHSPHNESEGPSCNIVIRSRDQATVWRNRYDAAAGTVERFNGASAC